MSEYFDGSYDFLSKTNFQLFKPNEDLVCCKDLTLNVLSGKIADNFIEPIKLLYDHFNNEYYKMLLDRAKQNYFTIPLSKKSNELDVYDKEIIMRYIESSVKYKMIITTKKIDNYDIFYELNNLTKNQLIGIIFQLEMQKNEIKKYDYYRDIANKFTSTLYCYYVEKKLNIANNESHYIIEDYNGIREITQVLFNDLSLEVLNLSRLDRIIKKNTYSTIFNHLIYKRFLYSKVKTLDQINFMLFSCSILFTLGTTKCKDIDLLVYHNNNSPEIDQTVKTFFINDKFPLIDFHMRGYGEWSTQGKKNYLDDWFLKEWPQLYGSNDLTETFFDPRFHYYFMGMKMISYKADIMRRVKRNRATSYTDLIMLDYLNGIQVKPFKLNREYWQNNEQFFYTDDELIILIKRIMYYTVEWHNLFISAFKVYNYIDWPDDFNLSDHQLKEIDDNFKQKSKEKNKKIFPMEENNKKIKFIIY